jgi:uroporphyrinogen-III synthase
MPTASLTAPLLIVRSANQVFATLTAVRAMGFNHVQGLAISTITPTLCSCPPQATALLLTSANALFNLTVQQAAHLPVYAVGVATARAAEQHGFNIASTGTGNATALAHQMSALHLPPHTFWHPCASNAGHGWYAQLTQVGHTVLRTPAYRSTYCKTLTAAEQTLLRSQPMVLLFSPAGARALWALYQTYGLPVPRRVVAISPAVAQVWGPTSGLCTVAASPNLKAMLKCLP